MENRSSGTISGHWAYCRYWKQTPKKPNNEIENSLNIVEATQAKTATSRKRSKRRNKLPQPLRKNAPQSENTSNVFQNGRNFRTNKLKGVTIISTEILNSALALPSTIQNKHGKCNIIYNRNAKPSKYVALDCEMVAGLGYPPRYKRVSLAARVSIVNEHLECIYNQYVKPKMKVVDYGTGISGVTKQDLNNYGVDFHVVQREVASIMKGKVLVGHSLCHDMNVLYLSHPAEMIRDTAKYAPLTKYNRGKTPSLKVLAKEILGLDIQEGAHDSVIDASASMQLYLALADEWETYIVNQKALETQIMRLKDEVWYDKRKYSEAECRYYKILAKKAKASKSEGSVIRDATKPTSDSNKTISPLKLDIVNTRKSNKQTKPGIVAASSVKLDGETKPDSNKSNPKKTEKFSGVPDSRNGSTRNPKTAVQQAACKNGDTNNGTLKIELLKELSSLEMGATYYLKSTIEPLNNSLDYIMKMAAIYTKENIAKQDRPTGSTEMDHRVDEVLKLVNAIKSIRNS